VRITFAPATCASCPNQSLCTPSKPGKRSRPRSLVVRLQREHEALQARRVEQTTEPWKQRYACRAGIEGTLSQGIRGFGLRCCRYVGRAKTHLQHVFTAAAINLARLDAWLHDRPRAQTRHSKLTALAPAAA
jgi:transposase